MRRFQHCGGLCNFNFALALHLETPTTHQKENYDGHGVRYRPPVSTQYHEILSLERPQSCDGCGMVSALQLPKLNSKACRGYKPLPSDGAPITYGHWVPLVRQQSIEASSDRPDLRQPRSGIAAFRKLVSASRGSILLTASMKSQVSYRPCH